MANVLLIDDDRFFMRPCVLKLEHQGGHTVHFVSNLGEAIQHFREQTFDVVVLDKNIGGHHGCIPFLEMARREKPHIPIVMHTGEDDELVPGRLGCDAFVPKRAGTNALLARLNQVLEQQRDIPPTEDYYGDRL